MWLFVISFVIAIAIDWLWNEIIWVIIFDVIPDLFEFIVNKFKILFKPNVLSHNRRCRLMRFTFKK